MKYFQKTNTKEVYGYDENDPNQEDLIQQAIDNGWKDITGSWPPPPTKEFIISTYEGAAKINLDTVAQSWGYDSIMTAISYVSSTNAQYKAEAEALNAWRDSYWAEAYTIEQGTLPDTAEAFVAMLPAAPTRPTA